MTAWLLSSEGFYMELEALERTRKERAEWTSIDQCKRAARRHLEEILEFVKPYPENDVDRIVSLIFAPDMKLSVADILSIPYWNATYHLGQITFVQTMYGDVKMH